MNCSVELIGMSHSQPPPHILCRSLAGSIQFMERLEAWMSVVAATLLSCFFVIAVLLPNRWALQLTAPVYLLLVTALAGTLEGRFLWRLWTCALRGLIPVGPNVATSFGNGRLATRILSASWWLAHAIVGLAFVISIETQILRQQNAQPGMLFLMSLFVFGFAICCNIFIAIIIKNISNRDSAVLLFWKWRLMVDASVTVFALSVA